MNTTGKIRALLLLSGIILLPGSVLKAQGRYQLEFNMGRFAGNESNHSENVLILQKKPNESRLSTVSTSGSHPINYDQSRQEQQKNHSEIRKQHETLLEEINQSKANQQKLEEQLTSLKESLQSRKQHLAASLPIPLTPPTIIDRIQAWLPWINLGGLGILMIGCLGMLLWIRYRIYQLLQHKPQDINIPRISQQILVHPAFLNAVKDQVFKLTRVRTEEHSLVDHVSSRQPHTSSSKPLTYSDYPVQEVDIAEFLDVITNCNELSESDALNQSSEISLDTINHRLQSNLQFIELENLIRQTNRMLRDKQPATFSGSLITIHKRRSQTGDPNVVVLVPAWISSQFIPHQD